MGEIYPIFPADAKPAARRVTALTSNALPRPVPPPQKPLRIIDPRTLQNAAVPVREWIVEDWLPAGHVTINYADGGVGKTLLAQQLMTAAAIGGYWAGLLVEKCRSFGLFCEDDEAELHRRQEAINATYGIGHADLGGMRWSSGVGADNTMLTFTRERVPQQTGRFEIVRQAAQDFGARLVILDTAADLFAGNENDRFEVRAFLGALNGLAQDINGAVLLNAHPSRSGMGPAGNMDGGSTAWSNSARSRWSLARPKAEDGEAADDTPERVLTRRKANYAPIGQSVRLVWKHGAFWPANVARVGGTAVERAAVDDVFLRLLDEAKEQGRHISESSRAPNYAPKAFAKSPDAVGYRKQDFAAAMERLFTAKRIRVGTYRNGGRNCHCIVRDDGGEG